MSGSRGRLRVRSPAKWSRGRERTRRDFFSPTLPPNSLSPHNFQPCLPLSPTPLSSVRYKDSSAWGSCGKRTDF